ncbi:MAG: hypothetical protein EBZ67_04855 [Chitinophagia bacterium]|nr:hypothetical protein [Chitinophagia bacterium]
MHTLPRRVKSFLHWHVTRLEVQARNLGAILTLWWQPSEDLSGRKVLVVTIRDFNHGRYGFQLLNYFHKAGYRIRFYRSTEFLIRLTDYDRMIWSLPGISFWKSARGGNDRSVVWLRLGWKGKGAPPFRVSSLMDVDLRYFESPRTESPYHHLPYFAHPLLSDRIPMAPTTHPRKRVFMYGQPDIHFDKASIEGRFGLMARSEVYRRLLGFDLPRFLPADFGELMQWLKDPSADARVLCLIDSRRFRVPLEYWMEVLSNFDFFIATPGFYMPQSHNLMEAMATGTVPVLQYHDDLRPRLRPGVDCVGFGDSGNLEEAIRAVLEMDEAEVERLRAGIIEYFSEHVDPSTVVEKLVKAAEGGKGLRLYFNAEEFSF